MEYAKLRGRIKEKYGRQEDFAAAMGMNRATLSVKLCGIRDWTRGEIIKACSLLDIPMSEVASFFLSPKCCENATL